LSVRPCANRSTGKEVNMRNRFDRQLVQLNNELIEMGGMIEKAISDTVKALVNQDIDLASNVIEYDEEIDHQEREIEQLCLKLLLQQQPVAKDLRLISAALKMITDMERIGDHATDISEITIELSKESYIKKLDHIQQMAKETMVMLVQSVEAFVNKDMDKARAVIVHDDVVDDLFNKVKAELIAMIHEDVNAGEQASDLLMAAKYFERIGDHATNISEWVIFSITGQHPDDK
jgi:phosphate transport system protein